jgi:TonB family protein
VTVTAHLLQSTACIGIAAILAFALRRAPARTRYKLWLFASLKFLIPLSLLSAAGSSLGAWASSLTTPRVSVVIRWLDQSLSIWGLDEAAAGTVAGLPEGVDRLALLALAFVWASGVLGLTVWRWRQWRDLAALASALPHLERGREIESLGRVARTAARPGRIPLLRCGASIEPGVLGVLQPKLLWPEQLSDRLTDAELDSLLAHEVCHVKRRDNLSAMIHVVVETLFWFHPAVWWVGSRLVSERERACDEEVLQMGIDNRSYAEGILKVCSFGFRAPAAFVAGVAGPRLAERIEWILECPNATPLSGPARLLLAAVVAVTLGAPVAAGALSTHRVPTYGGRAPTAACDVTMPVPERPADDPHASPFLGEWYANADRTMWASGGSPVPGTLRTKVLWVRPAGSELRIDARRLDGDAGPISATIPSGYPWTYQASGLTFSTSGCWQITGTAGGKTLQFILRIAEPARLPGTNAAPAATAASGHTSPESAQDKPKAYRPGGDVKPPRLVSEVKPNYTPEAMEARIQGSLKLEAVVLDTGDVGDVEVTQSLDDIYGLDNEAVKALKQWRFEPGTKDGKPVAVLIEVEMSFTLK